MQLIPEGPNIPEQLLNAHAEGNVVFFCGAGVSVDAGYPLFAGLVSQLRIANPVSNSPELDDAIKNHQFDFALSILERKIGGEGQLLRAGVHAILSEHPKTLDVHEILLDLASQGRDQFRLVTTNFDRLFMLASKKFGAIAHDAAPRLPIPKKNRWNSIVHLHGILPAKTDVADSLYDLILTSADFGEAYITDSYCSRFVVELLRNFTVVFVGYSLNDPVMRYLLDAISVAQSRDGASFKRPYALIPHKPGKKDDVARAWEHRPVELVPYLTKQRHKHLRLYKTLGSWAKLAAGGQRARETLALNEAQKPYLAEDDFTKERLLWALNDETGRAAQGVAETKGETASISWLPIFAQHGLLDQIYTSDEWQEEIKRHSRPDPLFSNGPVGYRGTITTGDAPAKLKPVSVSLLWWMQRHLNEMVLADWFLSHGGVPHPQFSAIYRHPRNKEFRDQLDVATRTFWDVLTSDAYRRSHLPMSRWYNLMDDFDLSSDIVLTELVTHLSLRLEVRPSIYRKFHEEGEQGSFLDQFQYALKISNPEFEYHVRQLLEVEINNVYRLADSLTETIAHGMAWLRTVNRASSIEDGTGYSIPSISPHDQNNNVDQFGHIVFLLRKSFDSLKQKNLGDAIRLALRWRDKPFPLFKRMFLYAATETANALDTSVLDLLTSSDLLWGRDIQRELKRYLRTRVRHWEQDHISSLIGLILRGPDHSRSPHLSGEAWENVRDRAVAALVKKLMQGEVEVPAQWKTQVEELAARHPWTLPTDHSDEFVIYSGGVRSVGWDDDVVPSEFGSFTSLTVKARLQNWIAERDLPQFRKLAVEQPEAAIATMEEALQVEFAGAAIWREGFYGLATALKAPPKKLATRTAAANSHYCNKSNSLGLQNFCGNCRRP